MAATLLWRHGALAADASAEAFIQRIGQQSIAILQQKSASTAERATQLKQVLNDSTDLNYVARQILGRHWRDASDAQRQDYMKLFDALVMQTMAERLNSYAGQTFQVTGQDKVGDTGTIVHTLITQPGGGQAYHVDWAVRQTADRYQLIDIKAEGVSLVITQRSEANDIVNQRGIDGLLAEMRRRLQQKSATG